MTENHLEKSRLVVAIVPSDTAAGRGEFRGIADAAGRRGWTLEMIDRAVVGTDLLPFHALLARADGIVARMGGAFADGTLGRLGVPVVGLDATPAPGAWACVTSDAKAIGTMAADELRSTPRASYVFVPMLRRYHWTEGRGRAFLARIRKAGGNARLYAPQTEWDWVGEREALAQWLAALPRPIGIFAGNDVLARFCLGACHSAGLDVPRDAATAAQAVELPVVTDVTLSQDSSTRVVTVNYTLSGTNAIITFDALTNGVSIGGENIHYVVGDVNKLVQPGQRALYWQARRSWPDQKVQNAFQARVTAHLSLAADGPRRIEALNADGEPVGEVESTYEDGRVRFLADTARFPGGVVGYRVQRKE